MSGREEFMAVGANAFDASAIVFRECLEAEAMTALYAGLLEASVSIPENIVHCRKGRKTGEDAIKDAAVAIAKRAAVGATVSFAITGAISLTAAGPFLVTIAPVLLPIGMALYGYAALKRILSALDDDLPLNHVNMYFCSLHCHTIFAYETGKLALMRWEASRIETPAV